MKMKVTLFTSDQGYDSIDLYVNSKNDDENAILNKTALLIETLYRMTDIEELSLTFKRS